MDPGGLGGHHLRRSRTKRQDLFHGRVLLFVGHDPIRRTAVRPLRQDHRLPAPESPDRAGTVSEENGEIEFLRKIVQGGTSKSYGIQVAKMAGLPNAVIKRSEDLMTRMQKDYSNNLATRKRNADVPNVEVPQLNLFN